MVKPIDYYLDVECECNDENPNWRKTMPKNTSKPLVAYERAKWTKAVDAMIEAGASCIAEVPGPNKSEIRFYCLRGGHVRIVQTYHGGVDGFEIYKPVTTSNKISDTVAAALDTSGAIADAAPAMLTLLRSIVGSKIGRGCIDGKVVMETLLPDQFHDAALSIIAKVDATTIRDAFQ